MAHGAEELDAVQAIGDLYRFDRFDRFAAPDELWEELQTRFRSCWRRADDQSAGGGKRTCMWFSWFG